jgi:glutaredoxin 3
MPKVTIYTTRFCPYCIAAKRLLASKQVAFEEIAVDRRPDLRETMTARAGGAYTVPQIWIGDVHVGGCDELYELEDAGRLDPLLSA